jgi:dTDP-4-dehydrorhamnose reductase
MPSCRASPAIRTAWSRQTRLAHRPILITGNTGQLALALENAARARGLPAVRLGRPAFDFDRPDSIQAGFKDVKPALVLNAAAYTAVDAAEDDAEAAARANRDGPAALAALCAAAGVPLLHVSTDYVFDGLKGAPYVEADPTAPRGVYGATKLAGEQAVLASGARALILRTSWVYAPTGRNFVRTMLNAALKTNHLRVVADQQGCPTAAEDLAETMTAIAARILTDGWQDAFAGVFHAAGTGATTWHAFAVAIFAEAARHGHPVPTVDAIATADWPTRAHRPADSRLDCARLESVFGLRLPPWRESIARTVDTLLRTASSA